MYDVSTTDEWSAASERDFSVDDSKYDDDDAISDVSLMDGSTLHHIHVDRSSATHFQTSVRCIPKVT